MLLAVSVLLSPCGANGGAIYSFVGPKLFGDDLHYATVDPFPPTPVSTIASNPPGQCAWINTGLAAFMTANPANGSGPSGQGWTFNWAGVAAEAAVEAQIKILAYHPFVVTPPAVTAANGTRFPGGTPGELGGAVLSLKYTPKRGTLPIPNLHWIQAYAGTRRGAAVPVFLDNDPAQPFTGQSAVTPFYDTAGYTAGTMRRGGAWFVDTPLVHENEYESNPVASMQFQVVLASDATSVVGGVIQNKVTLYGGEWWGFTYSADDDTTTPEPSTFLLLILGGSGLLYLRRMTPAKGAV
ncbi:MAG TPA: PEP-CTERM sorting domain-containing protein [Pirellulales bacterium]|nr:PEP-CTERM sorting domain-containing protein [Pirellulales bacterium]